MKNIISNGLLILEIHGQIWSISLNFHLYMIQKKKHFELQKKVISKADLTLTVSNSWSNEFFQLGAKRTAVVYNGFDKVNSKLELHDKQV